MFSFVYNHLKLRISVISLHNNERFILTEGAQGPPCFYSSQNEKINQTLTVARAFQVFGIFSVHC